MEISREYISLNISDMGLLVNAIHIYMPEDKAKTLEATMDRFSTDSTMDVFQEIFRIFFSAKLVLKTPVDCCFRNF